MERSAVNPASLSGSPMVLVALALALFLTSMTACSPHELGAILNTGGSSVPLTQQEVGSGLREALRVGAERSVATASKVDGFWTDARLRIPFPEEAIQVKRTLLDLGMNKPVEDLERTMNRAAEQASAEAVPVLVDAIMSMTIEDAFAVLRGNDQAATDLLRARTSDALRTRFAPIVAHATEQVALTSYWTPLAKAYNTTTLLTGQRAVDPDLNAYVAQRALDGLFVLLAAEEQRIRRDPVARTTALLQRVFAQH